jgi:hypothetical protein
MKMIGAHVCSQVEIESHEYHAGDSGTCGVACASSVNSVASLPVVRRQVRRAYAARQ